MKIDAAVVRSPGTAPVIETLELAAPRDGEILVRLVASGVCHTDLACAGPHGMVPTPIVLGHEGAGVVEQVGAGVSKVRPGDHVVLTINSCGVCIPCNGGHATYCDQLMPLNFGGSRADGSSPLSKDGESVHGAFFGQSSFATFALSNERNTVKIPQGVPLELLGPLGCGVQTGAGTVFNSFEVDRGQTIAVFGAGAVGLSAVMAANIVGAERIIAIDPVPARLLLARELGATDTINPDGIDTRAAIMALEKRGVDFAFDTTGVTEVIRAAILSLAPLGTCGLVGGTGNLDVPAAHIMAGGRRIRGIVEGDSQPDVFIPRLIELWHQGRFPFDRLVKFYDFADIARAFADSAAGHAVKPILRLG